MKKKFIHLVLLYSLFFNITHATVIALEDDCHHETTSEYVLDAHVDDDCGDLCDMHHLFHFMAILATPSVFVNAPMHTVRLIHKNRLPTAPFKQTTIKPPIA